MKEPDGLLDSELKEIGPAGRFFESQMTAWSCFPVLCVSLGVT